MGDLRKILNTLKDLGESDLTALAICAGVERDLVRACLDQLVRVGKVRRTVLGVGVGDSEESRKGCSAGCCTIPQSPRNAPIELYSLVFSLAGRPKTAP